MAQSLKDRGAIIKRDIEASWRYFCDNYDNFDMYRRFAFIKSISDQERNILRGLQRSVVEINVIEAYLSRLRGEFAKQEPGFDLSANNVNPQVVKKLEMLMSGILNDADGTGFSDLIYKDQLSGGFGVAKIYTAYENNRTWDQVIRLRRANDPTMCGFDPLANEPHKGDGRFCYEINPVLREVLVDKYRAAEDISEKSVFIPFQSFGWTFTDAYNEDVMLVVDFYQRQKKRVEIVELSDGKVMTLKAFEAMRKTTDTFFDLMPTITRKRTVLDEVIHFYRICGDRVLEHRETDFSYLPLVFFDGDSLVTSNARERKQITRPYFYHAIDLQRLKNIAASVAATQIESASSRTMLVAEESIENYGEDKLSAYLNPAQAAFLQYKSKTAEGQPINQPIPLEQQPLPPEVIAILTSSDQQIQSILGTYDAALGINGNNLSGKAIQAGSNNSNMAAMPYLNNYSTSFNQVAQVILDLIPKRLASDTRSYPVKDQNGARQEIQLTTGEASQLVMDNGHTNIGVRVNSGISFEAQKQQALEQLTQLSQALPQFAQMLQWGGLGIICDNLNIRGADELKQLSAQFMQFQQQQAQQAQGQQQQNPQVMLAMMKAQNDTQRVQNQREELELKKADLMARLTQASEKTKSQQQKDVLNFLASADSNRVQLEKAHTERLAKAADLELRGHHQVHQHHVDLMKMFNELTRSQQNGRDESSEGGSGLQAGEENQQAGAGEAVQGAQ